MKEARLRLIHVVYVEPIHSLKSTIEGCLNVNNFGGKVPHISLIYH